MTHFDNLLPDTIADSRSIVVQKEVGNCSSPPPIHSSGHARGDLAASRTECSCQLDIADWYRRYGHDIHRFVLSRTGEPTAADDCTSETFLRALTRRKSFHCTGAGTQPWLIAIAKNIVHDYHRSANYRYEIPSEVLPDQENLDPSPEQLTLRRELTADLASLLDRLPPDQAKCLRLRFLQQATVKETAQAMGRDEGAVRSLQYRAVRKLALVVRTLQES